MPNEINVSIQDPDIIIPLVFVVLIAPTLFFCFQCRRQRRLRQEQAAITAALLEAAGAGHTISNGLVVSRDMVGPHGHSNVGVAYGTIEVTQSGGGLDSLSVVYAAPVALSNGSASTPVGVGLPVLYVRSCAIARCPHDVPPWVAADCASEVKYLDRSSTAVGARTELPVTELSSHAGTPLPANPSASGSSRSSQNGRGPALIGSPVPATNAQHTAVGAPSVGDAREGSEGADVHATPTASLSSE